MVCGQPVSSQPARLGLNRPPAKLTAPLAATRSNEIPTALNAPGIDVTKPTRYDEYVGSGFLTADGPRPQ